MDNRVRGLMEGFTSGLLGAGVDAPLFEALGAAAPPADRAAGPGQRMRKVRALTA